jgi:sorbitol-specific phosphotransferase system component IIC
MEQILDRLVTLLIAISNLTKLSGQKRVNDRSEKNDRRNEVERLPLNPAREFPKSDGICWSW